MKMMRRIVPSLVIIVIIVLAVQMMRADILFSTNTVTHEVSAPFMPDSAVRLSESEKSHYIKQKFLIVYSAWTVYQEELSNVEKTLQYLQIHYDTHEITDAISDYSTYDLVIFLQMGQVDVQQWTRLYSYIGAGGRLLYLGNGTNGDNDLLKVNASDFGVVSQQKVLLTNSVYFHTEILTGITGSLDQNEDIDAANNSFQALDVELSKECRVHMETKSGNPLIWEKPVTNGKIMVMNTGHYESKLFRGLLTGTISILQPLFAYPVIGSETIFIDDFPADYYSDQPLLKQYYDRNMQQFVMEIWWPDMVRLMQKYHLKYTGAFIESYTNNVEGPFEDNLQIRTTTERLASELLKYGGEISLHGYNHQPLLYQQEESMKYGYLAWPDGIRIISAIQKSISFFNLSFPNYRLYTYVPPSNMMDPSVIPSLKKGMPDLKTISGFYFPAFDESGVVDSNFFTQEFCLDEAYGVGLPRVSAGSILTNEMRYKIASVMTTHGIISHLVHSDDILDPERGLGMQWNELYQKTDRLFQLFERTYGWLSKNTASEASEKTKQYLLSDLYFQMNHHTITLVCDNFNQPLSVILMAPGKIIASENCDFQKIDSIRYLVTMHRNQATLEVQ